MLSKFLHTFFEYTEENEVTILKQCKKLYFSDLLNLLPPGEPKSLGL